MTEIKWQSPPRRSSPNASLFPEEVRAALKSRPGEWAVVHTTPTQSLAGSWRSRYGAEGFEFTSRAVRGSSPTQFEIYARYVGEAGTV
jgi:hypothetical protein